MMKEGFRFPIDHSDLPARLAKMAEPLCCDQRPSALVIADAHGREAMDDCVADTGLRLLDSVSMADAAGRLDRIAAVDLILLQFTRADQVPDALLARLGSMASANDIALVVMTGLGGIDCTDAMLGTGPAILLCNPSETEMAKAVTFALRERARAPELRDIGGETDATRLERLSEEVGRIARTLDALTRNGPSAGSAEPQANGDPSGTWLAERQSGYAAQPGPGPDGLDATHVRELLRARRLRDQFLPGDLFADPAWDMLLDLMAARLSGERVSVSSLCIAASVPPTTALRWIRQLTERGIFQRAADPDDGRRVFIVLSDEAAAAIERWFVARRRMLG